MLNSGKKIFIRISPAGDEVELTEGETLYSALASRVPQFTAPCQGRGLCGRCLVKIKPSPPPLEKDWAHIPSSLISEGWRLACRHTLGAAADITLPELPMADLRITKGHIISEPDPFLRVETDKKVKPAVYSGRTFLDHVPNGHQAILAAALDLGTTNIGLQLIDVSRPAILGTAHTINPQNRYGEDVISRIRMASRPSGLKVLQRVVIEAVNRLIDTLMKNAGVEDAPIYELAAAANPAMSAIFVGMDPSDISRPPYFSSSLPLMIKGMSANGLHIHEKAGVRMLPAMGAFVGGDITAGLIHAGILPGDRRKTFYIDLGTNGELVIKAGARYWSSSTAAGPALEGWKISCGMRADEGAIESVSINGDIATTVIGRDAPVGICGTGLLDLLSGLIKSGLVLPDGNFITTAEAAHFPFPRLAGRLTEREHQPVFLIGSGQKGEIFFSQSDIRELQLAKSAIRTGIEILLDESGTSREDIDRVVVAGNLGFHLNRASLTGAGFLPSSWLEKIEFAGNSALAGAAECLLFKESFKRASAISRSSNALNLAEHPSFKEHFMANLNF